MSLSVSGSSCSVTNTAIVLSNVSASNNSAYGTRAASVLLWVPVYRVQDKVRLGFARASVIVLRQVV